jgi:branched-chain amino acid transport system permease protein
MNHSTQVSFRPRLQFIALLAGLIVLPLLLNDRFFQHILTTAFIYVVLILGLNTVIGLTGQVSLSQAALYGVGAYTSAILAKQISLPFPLSFALAICVSASLGFLLSACVVKMRSHYLALATIGFGEILINVFRSAENLTGGANGLSTIPAPRLGPWIIDTPLRYCYLALAVAIVCYAGMLLITRSQLGNAFLAVRDNEFAASSLGLNTVRLKILAFTLGAGYAGAAGALYAHLDGFIGPESFSTSQSILLFCVLVVGGLGHPLGSLIGALLFVIGQEFFRAFSHYQLLLFGSTVIIVMVFAPQGIAGLLRSMFSQRSAADKSPLIGTVWNPNGFNTGPSVTTELLSSEKPAVETTNVPESAALVIKNLVVRYGGVTAVNDVSFYVNSGEIVCLIGPNGAGKTTLLNVIGGQQQPAKGSVILNSSGTSTSEEEFSVIGLQPHDLARVGLARTFQTSQLFSDLSTLENVLAGQYPHRKTRTSLLTILFLPWIAVKKDAAAREEAERWLKFTGLYDYRYHLAKHLPYGLRRVLEIARCLATNPRVLLLDEPSAGMSSSERKLLASLLRSINKLGVTLIIVAHDLDLVRRLGDHVVVLDSGKIIFDGSPQDLRDSEKVIDAYLGKRRTELEVVF